MLDKKYNHLEVEKNKYQTWKESGYFTSNKKDAPAFTIIIPPPNVTGKLHLGHAWNTALQDILIRYKRMQGFDTLWLPGMDHAGIATQAKVDKRLQEEGISPRSLKRKEWLKHAWAWKEEYAENIHAQWAKLGLSLDYTKERFTLDQGLNQAVKKVFVDLYNKGLIYRGERIINWDPVQMTALSDEEVIYKEDKGYFYHLKYYLEDKSSYLDVATTRPETLFGDTAVAVNKNDERYKHLIGKNVILPVVNKLIPIIADDHADMTKGSGAVKITPAHDPNDFEVGLRHNLKRIVIMNKDATMNEHAGKYQGLSREECRQKLVEDLKKADLLIKEEPIVHSVGHSERTDAVIEPYLSKQWFVKMRPLAARVLENQKNKETKVNFIPPHFEKTMNHWMEITYDWCISRQLWWGHQIPAWYKGDEIYVGINPPTEEGWTQDEDVLDTWFSSALWPFSTLGWPENTPDFLKHYPNDVLVTGYDIIPFWVNRMTFQGLEFTNKRPFKDCLIHGLIRDKIGRKMSKSLGNGVDPMEVIDNYGADALRFYLTTSVAAGTDLRYDEEKVKSTWNFINKLWNASRFVLMNLEDFAKEDYLLDNLSSSDKWIISKLHKLIKNVHESMDKYEFNNVGSQIYNFIWEDFCDSYIEISKFSLNLPSTKSTLYYVLNNIIRLLHPFMPYVTEEIYQALPFKKQDSIMLAEYPEFDQSKIDNSEERLINSMLEFIRKFRNIKAENNMDKSLKVKLENNEDYTLIIKMLKLQDSIVNEDLKISSYIVEDGKYKMTIYFEKEATLEELENKEKLITNLKNSIARREKLLANENYLKKAPANLVEQERQKLQDEKTELANLQF